jgi:uncharacterized protein
MEMNEEYDFSSAQRGVFYRPNEKKRYLISYDHKPAGGVFEIYTEDKGHYRYRLRDARGTVVVNSESFKTKEEVLQSIDTLRETVIGADTVVAQ